MTAACLCAVALLHLAIGAGAQIVNVTVDDLLLSLTDTKSTEGERMTLGSMTSLSITCRANSTITLTQASFSWRKASTNDSITLDGRASVSAEITNGGLTGRSVLKINYPVKSDVTSYVCTVNQTYSATGNVNSAPLLTLTTNGVNEYDASVWHGDAVTIACVVNGNPTGNITWSKSVDPTFNVTGNTTIVLASVSYYADRGYITCYSSNIYGQNSATMFLRVKNPMSYLAPLLAVIVEIVLMLIIAGSYELYDKRRQRVGDGGDLKSE